MFNGRCGEAFFLAALFRATREEKFRGGAIDILGPLESRLTAGAGRELLEEVGFGLSGLGSMIYALVWTSRLLDRGSLLEAAAKASEAYTRETIKGDDRFEVFWGTAGGIPGLLALQRATGSDVAMNAALACADHLLSHRVTDPETGNRVWGSRTTREPRAGFAHGSTGIAHMLLQVFEATGFPRFYDAAMEVFDFERALYREEINDWPDHRDQPSERVLPRWCHGAIGVGFSRLAALRVSPPRDQKRVLSDIEAVVRKVLSAPFGGLDNLCCGSLGRIDFLVQAGGVLGELELLHRARDLAGGLAEHVQCQGYHPVDSGGPPHRQPGLWQGLAGIGYTFLRLSQPTESPCILMLS